MFRQLGLLVLVLLSVGAFGSRRPDVNSFLDWKVGTLHQLVDQVRKDHVVADRYMRHFAMTSEIVVRYLKQLHLAKLQYTTKTKVYSVVPGGSIKVHSQVLRHGTRVFKDPKGRAILILKCGNPVTLGPNAVASEIDPPEIKGAAGTGLKAIAGGGGGPSDASVPGDAVALMPTPESLTPIPPITPPVPLPTPPVTPPKPTINPPTTHPPLEPANPVNPLGLVGTIGGSLELIHILRTSSGHHHPRPVPEPSSVLILAPLSLLFLRRKNSQRAA